MTTMFLIYVLMTIPQIGVFFGVTTLALAVGGGLTILFSFIINERGFRDDPDEEERKNKSRKAGLEWGKKFIIGAAICGAVTATIPSKETTYILAGAFVAEKVVTSDIGQDVIALVHKNIKEALKEEVK